MLSSSIARLHPRFVDLSYTSQGTYADLYEQWFGNVILRLSPSYVRGRPESLPLEIPWPEKEDVVDSLANIANLRWP